MSGYRVSPSSPDATDLLGLNLDPSVLQVIAGATGTVTIKEGKVIVTYASGAAAITLAPPTAGLPYAGGDDGKTLDIITSAAEAHVVTCSQGFNSKGSSGTCTFTAAKGNKCTLLAYNGQWVSATGTGVTFA